jgi:hypothetical protein
MQLPDHVDPKHPVLSQEYAIFTPAIHSMVQTLGDWIDQKQPGGYVWGPSRFGKSRGVKWFLGGLLEERFDRALPLYVYNRPPSNLPTESGFWRGWLRSINHAFADTRRSSDILRSVFRQFLKTACVASNSNFVVLVIDEAQDMTIREWGWLHGLQNELDSDGFRLSVYSIASHQIGYQYDLLSRAHYAHYAARFMVAHWRFPGLMSADEVSFVLQGYDEASEWPAHSGRSYLAHFAPGDHLRGERLHQRAQMVWNTMVSMLPQRFRGPEAFPMQHLAWATEHVLHQLAAGMSWEDATSKKAWTRAFAQTQLSDHMRLISASS